MNTASRPIVTAALLPLCWALSCLPNPAFGQAAAADISPAEQSEFDRLQKRLREHEGALNAASWTLIHCADEKELQALEGTLKRFEAFGQAKQATDLEPGSVQWMKDTAVDFLRNKDPVVRGFGAILIAAMGETEHKSDVARLLEDKGSPPTKEETPFFFNFDRSRAAMALGMLGAKEYAPRLSRLLHSSDRDDRSGAALGLGYMGAAEYTDDIARLLSDEDDRVRTAATYALASLGARKHAKDIAKLLTDLGDPMVAETACYALAKLKATEHAKDLAALLKVRYQERDAAKALALLKAK